MPYSLDKLAIIISPPPIDFKKKRFLLQVDEASEYFINKRLKLAQ